MKNEVFISKNPMGYTLKKRTNIEGEVTSWEDVIKGGKSFGDLVKAIVSLPLYFRTDAEVNYGRPEAPFPLTDYEKRMVKLVMEEAV
jgi:hypothetical protein